jgi:hypothetical protein
MLEIMRDYGSEVSDTAMPPRKSYVQKASVVRQFRRWNPNFTEWFVHVNGKWMPKLGKDGELKRRHDARLAYSSQRMNKKQKTSTDGISATNPDTTPSTTTTTTNTNTEGKSTSSSSIPLKESVDSKIKSEGDTKDRKNLIAV